MINFKYSILLAVPLLLSGCVIIDADDADLRSVAVLHEEGEAASAEREASVQCATYGRKAKLVNVEEVSSSGQLRSLFNCY